MASEIEETSKVETLASLTTTTAALFPFEIYIMGRDNWFLFARFMLIRIQMNAECSPND